MAFCTIDQAIRHTSATTVRRRDIHTLHRRKIAKDGWRSFSVIRVRVSVCKVLE